MYHSDAGMVKKKVLEKSDLLHLNPVLTPLPFNVDRMVKKESKNTVSSSLHSTYPSMIGSI